MAIAPLMPSDHDPIEDPVSFDEAALMFRETGAPEFQGSLKSVRHKLQRWAREDGLRTEGRRGCTSYVDFSDLLESHAERYPPADRRRD